jgi:predicted metal-dependent enzyme (double-stranded beta helix superfamily)
MEHNKILALQHDLILQDLQKLIDKAPKEASVGILAEIQAVLAQEVADFYYAKEILLKCSVNENNQALKLWEEDVFM